MPKKKKITKESKPKPETYETVRYEFIPIEELEDEFFEKIPALEDITFERRLPPKPKE